MTAISGQLRAVATASRHYMRVREGYFAAPTLPGFVRVIKATLDLRTAFGREESTIAGFAFNVHMRLLKVANHIQMLMGNK